MTGRALARRGPGLRHLHGRRRRRRHLRRGCSTPASIRRRRSPSSRTARSPTNASSTTSHRRPLRPRSAPSGVTGPAMIYVGLARQAASTESFPSPAARIRIVSARETGKVLTANRLADGDVVFLTRAGDWSLDIDEAALALEPDAAKALEARGNEASRVECRHRALSVRCRTARRPRPRHSYPRAHPHPRPDGADRSRQAGRRPWRRFPASGS